MTSKITFASSPISVVYSNYDNKIYVGCKNGKLYSVEVTGTTPSFVRNLGGDYIYGLIAIDKYIAASCSNGYLRILNLETNTLVSENSFYYNTSRDMIFNKTNNVLYGSNGSYLFRLVLIQLQVYFQILNQYTSAVVQVIQHCFFILMTQK